MKKRLQKYISLLSAAIMIFMLAFGVCSEERTTNLKKVRIACPSQEVMLQSNMYGNANGYTLEYMRVVGEYAGWEVEPVYSKRTNINDALLDCMNMLEAGEADFVGAVLQNENMEEIFAYPRNNYGIVNTVLLATHNNPYICKNNLTAQQNLKVAVISGADTRNSETREYLDSCGVGYTFIPCQNDDEQIEKIKSGEADVMVGVSLVPVDGTVQVAAFADRQMYIISSKDNTDLIAQFDNAVDKLNQVDNTVQTRLFEKYFSAGKIEFSLTEQQKQYVESRGKVKVLCQNEAPPFQYTDKNGNITGLSVMVLNDISKLTGLEFEIIKRQLGVSVMETLNTGGCDMMMAMPKNYKLSHEYQVIESQTLIEGNYVKIVHKGSEKKDKEDWIVASPKGSVAEIDFTPKEIQTYGNVEECINAVNTGKADFAIVNSLTFSYYTELYPYWNVILEGTSQEIVSYSFAFNTPLDTELGTIFNNAIKSMDYSKMYSYTADIIVSDASHTLWGAFQKDPIRVGAATFAAVLLLVVSLGLWIAYRMMRKKNIALHKAYSAKSDFLSHMSHEIRTPLNAIMGFSELGEKESNQKNIKDYFKNIKMSGTYLLGMINDILDMSKIEKEKIMLLPEIVDFSKFIGEISALMEEPAREKNVELSFLYKGDVPHYAVFDRVRVQQVLGNLISNAIKYSHAGGKIICTIGCSYQNSKDILMKFSVQDYGVGMSEEFMKRMFEPFLQEKNEYTSSTNSCGLGLSIAKKLIDIMGGSVDVKSAVGKGSTFTVLLPLQKADSATQKQNKTIYKRCDYSRFKGVNVLLCEDHPLNAQILQKLLEKRELTVDLAENGRIGVDKYLAAPEGFYKVILMDIQMPVMNGVQACAAIRSAKRSDSSTIPIIAVTANVFENDVRQTQNAGMNGCVEKPIDPETLYETIYKCIFEDDAAI